MVRFPYMNVLQGWPSHSLNKARVVHTAGYVRQAVREGVLIEAVVFSTLQNNLGRSSLLTMRSLSFSVPHQQLSRTPASRRIALLAPFPSHHQWKRALGCHPALQPAIHRCQGDVIVCELEHHHAGRCIVASMTRPHSDARGCIPTHHTQKLEYSTGSQWLPDSLLVVGRVLAKGDVSSHHCGRANGVPKPTGNLPSQHTFQSNWTPVVQQSQSRLVWQGVDCGMCLSSSSLIQSISCNWEGCGFSLPAVHSPVTLQMHYCTFQDPRAVSSLGCQSKQCVKWLSSGCCSHSMMDCIA